MADLYTIETVARKELTKLIMGGNAHATFEEAIHGLPDKLRGVKPEGMPYSIWQLVDHIRIAQWDILKFSTNPEHQSPKWPEGYWHKNAAPKSDEEWQTSIDQIHSDRQKILDMISDRDTDLFEPFETEQAQTLFREILLIADHASYHIGEIIVIRRLLRAWH